MKIVRDNTGITNTATHTYTATYDADGNQTAMTDSSPGAAVTNYVMAYDQLDRDTSVTEQKQNSDGTFSTIHTTTYGYDAASNFTSQTHDGATSSYTYNNLNQLVNQSDTTSSTGTSPQITTFAYTPTGQVAWEAKPNGNTVTSTFFANGLLYQQNEKTSGDTLVSSHQYSYDPNGNTTQDVEQLMSADTSSTYLNHTLGYTYDPTDQVATVTTDGTQTESYTHDANNNVTSQQITSDGTTTTTDYNYYQGQLVTASVAGGTTADYNYDPFGRLDTITAAGQTLQSNTYDRFDNLASTSQWNTTTQSMDTTSYAYDSLNRMVSQTTPAGTSSFSYLGLSGELASEQDPNSTSKTYDYTPYGSPVTSMFTGQDKNNATPSPTSTTPPYSSYRFNAMRWDSTTGQYDMGFRNYDPGINQFASRDMYDGALADAGLTTDPFTGSQYAFGDGNPISNIELDGHMLVGPSGGGGTGGSCLGPVLSCNNTPNYFNLPPASGTGIIGSTGITGAISGSSSPGTSFQLPFQNFIDTPTACPVVALICPGISVGLTPGSSQGGGISGFQPGGKPGTQRGVGVGVGAFSLFAAAAAGTIAKTLFDENGGCLTGQGFNPVYGPLDTDGGTLTPGRATSALACITPATPPGTGTPKALPGYDSSYMQLSHLLGRQFGGYAKGDNIVLLSTSANREMETYENQVAALKSTQNILYYVRAIYSPFQGTGPGGNPYMPTEIYIAWESSGGETGSKAIYNTVPNIPPNS